MNRSALLTLAARNFEKMQLDVFLAGTDYRGMKPDMVVVHKAKQLYYLIEIVGIDCIDSHARLKSNRADQRIRKMCSNLFSGEHSLNTLTTTLYCDLGQGIDLFRYNELQGHKLNHMKKYAAVVYPCDKATETERALQTLGIKYKGIEIQGKYYFTLFSEADTQRLAEARKFMQYMLTNKEQQ